MLSIGKMVAGSGEYYIATVAQGRRSTTPARGSPQASGWGRGPAASSSRVRSTPTISGRSSPVCRPTVRS